MFMLNFLQTREKLHTMIQMKLHYKSSQVRYEYINIEIET